MDLKDVVVALVGAAAFVLVVTLTIWLITNKESILCTMK